MNENYFWTPRDHALSYGAYNSLPKDEFDELVKSKQFSDGPFLSAFGDGYGEPYNPNRQAFGTLKDGRKVFTETVKTAPPLE